MVRETTRPQPARNIVLSPGKIGSVKRNFILEYLGACKEAYAAGERLEEGEYVQGLYNAWKHHCYQMEIPAGTSTALRQVVHNLKKEGAIEHYATRPAEKSHFWNRNYYRVTLE